MTAKDEPAIPGVHSTISAKQTSCLITNTTQLYLNEIIHPAICGTTEYGIHISHLTCSLSSTQTLTCHLTCSLSSTQTLMCHLTSSLSSTQTLTEYTMDPKSPCIVNRSIKSSFIDYTFEKNAEGFTRARI